MNDNQLQQVFGLCSHLLSYPDPDFIDILHDIEDELNKLPFSGIKNELHDFSKKAVEAPLSELISTYVNTFDFGKKTNLYVTYMSNGEQRERGMDLLYLKNYYKMHGFNVTDKELPDYLPIILEFASQVNQETIKPVFERYYTNIKELAGNINAKENLYGHILKAIMLALEKERHDEARTEE